jgi:imidazolonepropionase-like amidohydrolase
MSRDERYRRLADLDLASAPVEKIVKILGAKKIVIDDTIALEELFMHTAEDNAKNEPGVAKLPRELAGTVGGAPAASAKVADAAFAKYIALLGELHRRGVPIVAGTDIGVMGHSLYRELELYVRAGFTPLEAIQAATIVPARVMKMDRELGTIEPGKRADLIVVAGDPLTDIHAIRSVVTVIARGKRHDSAKLWRLVGFSP